MFGLRGANAQPAWSPTSPEHGGPGRCPAGQVGRRARAKAHCQWAVEGRRRACFRGTASPRPHL
eukprot:15160598-Alexandrium_andersonii.AAC.1